MAIFGVRKFCQPEYAAGVVAFAAHEAGPVNRRSGWCEEMEAGDKEMEIEACKCLILNGPAVKYRHAMSIRQNSNWAAGLSSTTACAVLVAIAVRAAAPNETPRHEASKSLNEYIEIMEQPTKGFTRVAAEFRDDQVHFIIRERLAIACS